MAFKIVVFAVLVALARAGLVPQIALTGAPIVTKTMVDAEYDPHPQYSYSYGVHDPLTGDVKSQTETRVGDVVKGQYSLDDSDGTKRIVDYGSDPINGFNAVVQKVPLGVPGAASVALHGLQVAATPVVAKSVSFAAPAAVTMPMAYKGAGLINPLAYSLGHGYGIYPHAYPYGGFARPYGYYW